MRAEKGVDEVGMEESAGIMNRSDSSRKRRFSPRLGCLFRGGLALFVAFTVFLIFHLYRFSAVHGLPVECREASQAKDWQQLESLAARWCWWEPEKAAPWIYRAEAATQTGEWEQAVALLGNLSDEDPKTPLALVERSGMQFNQLNCPLDGAESLERAVRLAPTLVEARRRLVFFYAFTLQRGKMVDHIREAIRLGCDVPEMYVYLMLQDSLSFANAYEENTRWHLGNKDEELFAVARAIYRIRTRGLDEAEDPRDGPRNEDGVPYHRKIISDYFKKYPQNLGLLNYHLHLASREGDTEELARLLAGAPAEAANDGRFWRYRGWLHGANGELQKAMDSYRKALELNPYDHIARHQMANVERRLKNMDQVAELEAISLEGKAIRQDLLQLTNVREVPPSLLKGMAEYAKMCGDSIVAERLSARVAQFSDEWQQMLPSVSLPPQ
jgi:tetratricopeptide (TPR) repeat protein